MIERHTHTHWKQGTDPRVLRWLLASSFGEHIHKCICISWSGNEIEAEPKQGRGKEMLDWKKYVLFFFLVGGLGGVLSSNHSMRTTLIHKFDKVAVTAEEFAVACTSIYLYIFVHNKFPHTIWKLQF